MEPEDKVYGGTFGWVSVSRGYGPPPKPMSELRAMAWGLAIMVSLGWSLTYAVITVLER